MVYLKFLAKSLKNEILLKNIKDYVIKDYDYKQFLIQDEEYKNTPPCSGQLEK